MNVYFPTRPLRRSGDRRGLGSLAKAVAMTVALAGGGLAALLPGTASAATGTFQSTANPGGGTIITGTLGRTSLQAATGLLMARVHTALGTRPTILQAVQNPHDQSLAVLFSAVRNGTQYSGITIVTASPGAQTGGAALYDTSARFPTTVGPMMRRLNTLTTPQAPAAAGGHVAFAPAERLTTHPFTDGTGSIGVPADWKITVAGGGSALVTGPGGASVSYNMQWSALDMSNPRAQFYMRTISPQQRATYMKRTAILAYTGDPVQAYTAIIDQLAKQGGAAAPQIRVTSATKNGTSADIVGTYNGKAHFMTHVFLLPPNPNGMWSVSNSEIFLLDPTIAREGATANAILNSIRINFGAVAAQGAAIRQMFQSKFEAEIANDQAQDAARAQQTQQALATDRAAQEGMHKQAVAMENYSLDRAVVVNTSTGAHSTVGTGFADALTHDNPNFQKVPAQNLLRGVDY